MVDKNIEEESSEAEKRSFWDHFIKAVDAEPRPDATIRGASGIEHPLLGLGVDEPNKRIVLISDSPDARYASMMQVDVERTLDDFHVVVARPFSIDLPSIASSIIQVLGSPLIPIDSLFGPDKINSDDISGYLEDYLPKDTPLMLQMHKLVPLNVVNQIQHFISQLTQIDWLALKSALEMESGTIDLEKLAKYDLMELDRRYGVCALPMYSLGEDNLELIRSGSRPDDVTEVLRNEQILQYFFPPIDQLALGMVDRQTQDRKSLSQYVRSSPSIGHPFGRSEIVGEDSKLDVLDTLMDRGLLVEGERFIEITPEGQTIREVVKYKPREGLVSKLISRIKVNIRVSTKDL